MIAGRLVRLRPYEREDIRVEHTWRRSPDFYGGLTQVSLAALEREFDQRLDDPAKAKFIVETVDSRPVGYVESMNLDWHKRQARMSIHIWEMKNRGQGYGTESTLLFLYYLFGPLNLHRVWLDGPSTNVSAINSFKKCGFRVEGTLREVYSDLQMACIDFTLMAVLRREFVDVWQRYKDECERSDLPDISLEGSMVGVPSPVA